MLAAIVPTAAGAADPWPAWDGLGNRYPADCRRDLSHIEAAVVDLSEADLKATWRAMARPMVAAGVMAGLEPPGRLYGFVGFGGLPLTIYLNAEMARYMKDPTKVDRLRADILHHERCHIQMLRVAGDASWHPAWDGRGVSGLAGEAPGATP